MPPNPPPHHHHQQQQEQQLQWEIEQYFNILFG